MKTSNTLRWGGLAYLLAGLSLILQQGHELLDGGAAFLNAFIKPVAPQLTSPGSPLFMGPAGLVILLAALLVTVGFILFGVSLWRAGMWRLAALLVIVGSWFGLAAVFSTPLFDVGGILFGVGNAWLGLGLWSAK